MPRLLAMLLVTLLFSACSDDVNEARQIIADSLGAPRDLEIRNTTTYPGGVVCGEFSAYVPNLGINDKFKPFITVRGRLYKSPKDKDSAFYCSDSSAQVLLETTGIGLFDSSNAELAKVTADLSLLAAALESYYRNHYFYPTMAQGLQALVTPPDELSTVAKYPREGYLESVPSDPWGRPYIYHEEQWGRTKGNFMVSTFGADGEAGGGGANADISTVQLDYLQHLAVLLE